MSYIYVMAEEGTKYYKIGLSKNRAEKRRSQLQTGNPRDITILYEFSAPDRFAAESAIEKQLAKFMTPSGGNEWYEFDTLDNLHVVLNRMISDRELSMVSSYDGDVNYISAIMNSIDNWVVVSALCAVIVPLLWFLVWSGAFL